jgi:hypothetical protein
MLLTRPKSLISRGEDRQTQTILDSNGSLSPFLSTGIATKKWTKFLAEESSQMSSTITAAISLGCRLNNLALT